MKLDESTRAKPGRRPQGTLHRAAHPPGRPHAPPARGGISVADAEPAPGLPRDPVGNLRRVVTSHSHVMNSPFALIILSFLIARPSSRAAFWFLHTTPAPAPLPRSRWPPRRRSTEPASSFHADVRRDASPAAPAATATHRPEAAAAGARGLGDEDRFRAPRESRQQRRREQRDRADADQSAARPCRRRSEPKPRSTSRIFSPTRTTARCCRIVKNPTMPEEVLDVFVTDLMNREDAVKLPTLLEIAKIPESSAPRRSARPTCRFSSMKITAPTGRNGMRR